VYESKERTSITSTQPVFAFQAVNPGELAFIGGNEGAAKRDGMSGDEKIVTAYWEAEIFQDWS